MLSQAQFERYQLSRYLKEWRESEWDKTARFLLTARMGQEAIKNIGEVLDSILDKRDIDETLKEIEGDILEDE